MNKNHFIVIDSGVAKIGVRMDEDGYFKGKNSNFAELTELNLTDIMNIPNILTTISKLKTAEPDVFKDSFKSRWDEIKNITLYNIALNRKI